MRQNKMAYLHNLRIIQPFTEDRLYQCKDLLEHHHHLEHTNTLKSTSDIENSCFAVTADSWKVLTGLGPVWGGADLMGGAFSPDSSSCLVMSSVVKRLDSRPRMWIMASLFEGFGWKEKPGSDCYLACFFHFKGAIFYNFKAYNSFFEIHL